MNDLSKVKLLTLVKGIVRVVLQVCSPAREVSRGLKLNLSSITESFSERSLFVSLFAARFKPFGLIHSIAMVVREDSCCSRAIVQVRE